MKPALLLAASLCFGLGPVPSSVAQVPDSGRWQELRYGADEVHERIEALYLEQVVLLAAAGRLDRDRALLRRVQAISADLIVAAIELKPEAADWQWEVHIASDPGVEASCQAGGKLLVGAEFLQRLALGDGELAVLLAHEIAHAIAEHHREFLSEAQLLHRPPVPLDVVLERLDSDLGMQVRLAGLSRQQEREADQLGMVIAHRAGWSGSAMLGFYRKLAADVGNAEAVIASHPSHVSRISMSRGMVRLLDQWVTP